jgi:hypothetical protein
VAVAAGFFVALASHASADVVEPQSAYQPASVGLLQEETAKAAVDQAAQAEKAKADEAKASEPDEVVVATPAPEQIVRQAPAHLVRQSTEQRSQPSVVDGITRPLRVGFQQIGASLGRVVGACDVGFGTGSGGPVLVFAVLAMAAPFIRRRVLATQRSADEDVPEFLYAQELTPPG